MAPAVRLRLVTRILLILLLLFGHLLVAKQHLAHALRNVSEFVLVLACEARDRLLGDVSKLIIFHSLAGDVLNPFHAAAIDLAGDVTELVGALSRELAHTCRHARRNLAAQIAHLVRLLPTEVGDRALDACIELDREIAELV